MLIRKDVCLKLDKSPYLSALQYGRKWEKALKHHLSLKLKFIAKKKLGNGKLWLYQLEKEPYFGYLCLFLFFFQLQKKKKEILKRGGYLCQTWRNVRVVLSSFVMNHDGGEWMGQKWAVLAWRNYWTASTFHIYCDKPAKHLGQ